ncbi:hypothetical protein GYH30_000730 [Glycine max]|nr:hypothetical protein GYH30_000730 [Glycine max]
MVIKENMVGFEKGLCQVRFKFEILDEFEFDLSKDVHEGVLMSINDIPKKNRHSSRPPTPPTETFMTNIASAKEEKRHPDDEKVNNHGSSQ